MIDWRLMIIVAGMIGFGLEFYQSGAVVFLTWGLAKWVALFGILVRLFALAIQTILLTQPMSNAAAALTMLPIAVSSAGLLEADPRAFAILVTLAASLSVIAPLEPTLLIVYGLGRYRFTDFIRVGGPLTLLMVVLLMLHVPVFWPL